MIITLAHETLGDVRLHNLYVEKQYDKDQTKVGVELYIFKEKSYTTVTVIVPNETAFKMSEPQIWNYVAELAGIPGAGWALEQRANPNKTAVSSYVNDNWKIVGTTTEDFIKTTQDFMKTTGLEGEILTNYLDQLPGINEIVKHPKKEWTGTVREIIIDLNDTHKWSREQIADWLDTLDVDLRFKAQDATVEKSETELKLEKLDAHLKELMEQIDLFQVSIADANKSFLALKEALKNEQS